MSMTYWGINGYGIKGIEDFLSAEKMNALMGAEGDEADLSECLYNYYESDIFEFCDNGDGSYYLLYSPNLPFELNEQEKAFTSRDNIIIAMYESVKHILLDDITPGCFKARMEWVSDYGASC